MEILDKEKVMKKVTALGMGAALAIAMAGAQAGSISLVPDEQEIMWDGMTPTTVSLDLMYDFTDEASNGGRMSLFFNDDVLEFSSFNFNFVPFFPDPIGNPAKFEAIDVGASQQPTVNATPGDGTPGHLEDLVFGTFSFDGLAGPNRVGTLNFNVVGMGESPITMEEFGTGFFSAVDPFPPLDPVFNGATVNVVPEMEVWAMLLAGMGLIGWKARRMREEGSSDSNAVIA